MKHLRFYLQSLVDSISFILQEMPVGEHLKNDLENTTAIFNSIFRSPDKHTPGLILDQETASYWQDVLISKTPTRTYKTLEELAEHLIAKHRLKDRISFVDESFTVYLDGDEYPHVNPNAYWILKVLAAHQHNRALSSKELITLINKAREEHSASSNGKPGSEPNFIPIPNDATGQQQLKRAIKPLCSPLKELIVPQKGVGRKLMLP